MKHSEIKFDSSQHSSALKNKYRSEKTTTRTLRKNSINDEGIISSERSIDKKEQACVHFDFEKRSIPRDEDDVRPEEKK